MRRTCTFVVTLALLSAAPCSWSQPQGRNVVESIPDTVPSLVPTRSAPEWVSESALVSEGTLQWDLFAPEDMRRVRLSLESGMKEKEAYLSLPPDRRLSSSPCISIVVFEHRLSVAGKTLEKLAEGSSGIYLGTIVAARPGLLRGVPRVLLRLKIERSLQHDLPEPQPESLLVAYPAAKVDVAGACIEAKSPRHPEHPEVGMRMLVFTPTRNAISRDSILTPEDEEVFFELPNGTTSLPTHFGELFLSTGTLSLDRVIRQTEIAIATVAGKDPA